MGTPDRIQIRTLARHEYLLIAEDIFNVHVKSLPSDVLPKFGSGYHMRYILQLLERQGNVFVAVLRGGTIGFLTSGAVSSAKRIIPRPTEILFFVKSSIRQPVLLPRLVRQILKRALSVPDSSEIEFFAVESEFRGRGVGRALIQQAQKTAFQSGFKVMVTKTNNLDLVRYYQLNHNAEVRDILKSNGTTYYFVQWPLEQS